MKDPERDGNSTRWKIDGDDKRMLEQEFLRKRFPSPRSKKRMADALNVEPRRIQVWFQNRRQREKGPEDEDEAAKMPAGNAAVGLSAREPAGARWSARMRDDGAGGMGGGAFFGSFGLVGAAPPPPARGSTGGSRSGRKNSGKDVTDSERTLHTFGPPEAYPEAKPSVGGRGLVAVRGPPPAHASGPNAAGGPGATAAGLPNVLASSDDIVYALMDFDHKGGVGAAEGGAWDSMRGRGKDNSLFGSSGSLVALEELCNADGAGSGTFEELRRVANLTPSAGGGASGRAGGGAGRNSLGGGLSGINSPLSHEAQLQQSMAHQFAPLGGLPQGSSLMGGAPFHPIEPPFPPSLDHRGGMGGSMNGSMDHLPHVGSSHSFTSGLMLPAYEKTVGGPTPSESSNESTTAWGSRGTPTNSSLDPSDANGGGGVMGGASFHSGYGVPHDSAAAAAMLEAAARGNYALIGGFAASGQQGVCNNPFAQQGNYTLPPPTHPSEVAAAAPASAAAVAVANAAGIVRAASSEGASGAATSALGAAPPTSASMAGAAVTGAPNGWMSWDPSWAADTTPDDVDDASGGAGAGAGAGGGAGAAMGGAAMGGLARPSFELGSNAASWSNAAAAVNAVLSTARQQYSLAMGRNPGAPLTSQHPQSYRHIPNPRDGDRLISGTGGGLINGGGLSNGGLTGLGGASAHSAQVTAMIHESDGHVRGGLTMGQGNVAQGNMPSQAGMAPSLAAPLAQPMTTQSMSMSQPMPQPMAQPMAQATAIPQSAMATRMPYAQAEESLPPLARPSQLLEQQMQLQQFQHQMLFQQQQAQQQAQHMQDQIQQQVQQMQQQCQPPKEAIVSQQQPAPLPSLPPPPQQQQQLETSRD